MQRAGGRNNEACQRNGKKANMDTANYMKQKSDTTGDLKANLTAHVEFHSIEHEKDYNCFKNWILLYDVQKWDDMILIVCLRHSFSS